MLKKLLIALAGLTLSASVLADNGHRHYRHQYKQHHHRHYYPVYRPVYRPVFVAPPRVYYYAPPAPVFYAPSGISIRLNFPL